MPRLRTGGSPWRRGIFHTLFPLFALSALLAPRPLRAEAPIRKLVLPLICRFDATVQHSPYYQGEFGYGLHTAYAGVRDIAPDLGFGYVKYYWGGVSPCSLQKSSTPTWASAM